MAKAKKQQESAETKVKKSAAPKKAAAPKAEAVGTTANTDAGPKKTAGKKQAEKKSGKSEPSGVPSPAPSIDTGLAAQTAAAMVANRGTAPAGNAGGPATESSSFKNLRDSLNRPSTGGLGGILGGGGSQKKFAPNFGGPKQAGGGRNQTFGADVNRNGIPRRTGG